MTNEQRDDLLLAVAKNVESLTQKTEELDNKGKQRDELLLAMSKNIESLNKKTEAMSKKIENMSESMERLNQKTEQYHQEALENHKKVVKELERQRINVAKLEHNLTEQIRALYDLSDVNNDKLQEHNEMFKEIQRTLDWHNRRLLKLETTN